MSRLRTPDYLAGLAGVLLLVGALAGGFATAVRVLLELAAVMALLLPVVTAVRDDPALPVKWDVLTAWATLAATLIVLGSLLNGAEAGDALALGGAVLAFAGACRAMREQAAPGLRTPPETRAMPTPPS